MAIFHLHAQTGSRNGGQSARAKAEYITRTGSYSRDRDEVLHSTSGHMPAWAAADPRAYWRAADAHERANGRLFKEVEFSLPRELPLDEQRQLADEFAQHLTAAEQLPYTLAIHRGGDENPHCHLMISERINDGHARTPETWFKRAASSGKKRAAAPESGGARKSVALKPRDWLEQTREAWAGMANAALERAGHAARIDHRSHAARGLETAPQIHLGPNVVAIERKQGETDRGDIHRRIEATNARILDFQAARARLDAEIAAARAEQEREERLTAAVQADPAAVMRRYRAAITEHRDGVTTQAESLLSRCEQQRQHVAESLAAERVSEPEAPTGLGAVFKRRRYDAEHAAWRDRVDALERRAVVLDRRVERLADYADENQRWGLQPSAGDQLADARLAAVQPELIEQRDIAEPLEREQKRQQAAQELEERIEKRRELDVAKRKRQERSQEPQSVAPALRAAMSDEPQQRHYLAVPYRDRHAAREAGATWDRQRKAFYVTDSASPALERWPQERSTTESPQRRDAEPGSINGWPAPGRGRGNDGPELG